MNTSNLNLVCNSFDVQYKRIQSFRNQYLTMIRLIMKNKSHLSINDIMKYYDKVIKVDYIEIPFENIRHSKLHIQKVYAKTFTKLHVL